MRITLWALRRLATAAVTLLGVSILVFAAARMLPGGFEDLVLGPLASPERRAEVTEQYGLDDGIATQYGRWIASAARGDLGTSFVSGLPVTSELRDRLGPTITIGAMAMAATFALGVPLGFATAVRSGSARPDGRRRRGGAAGRLVSALGVSVPEFVLASVVVFLFSRYSLGLSIGDYVSWGEDPLGHLRSLLLPAAVLSVFCIAATARATRDSVANVLVEPHVTAAVARGETPWHILRHHVARNAALPILTITTTIAATLLGGTVIIETIFDVPGVGSYLVAALNRRDYAVTQAGVLLAAAAFIASSVTVDLLAAFVDPRVASRLGSVQR
ncbi:MAG: ABC transporter permease [Actinomycetota bacterium]|nr:ABC transporter permease [Actinomycetota bacterium]